MGICYYCQRPATKKARVMTTGEIVNVCDYHADWMNRIEKGRNAGFGAGIG